MENLFKTFFAQYSINAMEIMPESHHSHPWEGNRAESFVHSMEKLVKYRYRPFAKQIRKAIERFGKTENSEILDIGCGPGLLLFEIKKLIPSINLMGLDSSEAMLAIANKKAKENHLEFLDLRQGSAESMPFEDTSIDIVTCLSSLHDFKEAKTTLREVYRVLRDEGLFILKDKNASYPKWKMRIQFVPLLFRIGYKRTARYFKSRELWFGANKVKNWMKEIGFLIQKLENKKDYVIIGKK